MSIRSLTNSALLIVAASIAASVAFPTFAAETYGVVVPLMKLLDSDRLPDARKPAVIEMICNRGGPDELAAMLSRATEGKFDRALTLTVLQRLADAAEVRKIRPSGDLDSINKLMQPQPGEAGVQIRPSAVRLAALWRTTGVDERLRALTADQSASDEVRVAAVDGLALLGGSSACATLYQIAAEANSSRLRYHAAAALAKLDLESAAAVSADNLSRATAADEVGPLIDAFLVRKGGPDKLARALGEVTLSQDAAKLALRHMYSVGRSDAGLSDVLSKAAGIAVDQPLPTAQELKSLLADVASHGNAERGEKIFRRADLSCMKCHAVARAGGQVGPELTAVGSISPVDYVANSILAPNLAVKEQFVTRVFTTDDGLTITGIVVDRDRQRVNVRDATGALVTIPTADIDEEEEGKSLMPQGLTKFLTRDELVDLVKFISELGRPGPYAVRSTPTVQRWRVMRTIPDELAGNAANVRYLQDYVLGAPAAAWSPAYGTARGDLPLDELGKPGDELLLQGELNVVEAGEVEIHFAPQGAQFWIDAESCASDAPIRRKLAKGLHRLTLRVKIGDVGNAARIELMKPAGSTAQFDVVGGS